MVSIRISSHWSTVRSFSSPSAMICRSSTARPAWRKANWTRLLRMARGRRSLPPLVDHQERDIYDLSGGRRLMQRTVCPDRSQLNRIAGPGSQATLRNSEVLRSAQLRHPTDRSETPSRYRLNFWYRERRVLRHLPQAACRMFLGFGSQNQRDLKFVL